MILKTLIAILLLFQSVQCTQKDGPMVHTKVGTIRGIYATDGNYSMFLGIPYGKLNESNPFGPSVPYPKFEKPFDANNDSAQCPQYDDIMQVFVGSLDCLVLNIYVPRSASAQSRLPVMLFIYGGNFEIGTAARSIYGPKFLVRHNVIYITISYRLGPYGFMCLRTPEVPGNQALKDQVLAMRWVRDNIDAFGGDVNSITVSGESAGARAIELHLISPQEKLFNKVIMESGTSTVRGTVLEPDTKSPLKLAEKLGLKTDDVSKALSYLATVKTNLVINATIELGILSSFRLCIEKKLDNVEIFMTDYAFNTKIPKVKNMSILIGYNNNEQVARYADKDSSFFDNLQVIKDQLENTFNFDSAYLNEMEKLVRHFYIGDKKLDKKVMWQLIDFDSDFTYNHPTVRSIRWYLENQAANIFHYVFSYTGGRNFYKHIKNVTVGGASHADELGYLYDMQLFYKKKPSPEDQLIIDKITTLWTNFAKFGNPTPETTELLPVKWEPVTKDICNFYNITTHLQAATRPFNDRMAFWNLFYMLNYSFEKGYRKQMA